MPALDTLDGAFRLALQKVAYVADARREFCAPADDDDSLTERARAYRHAQQELDAAIAEYHAALADFIGGEVRRALADLAALTSHGETH